MGNVSNPSLCIYILQEVNVQILMAPLLHTFVMHCLSWFYLNFFYRLLLVALNWSEPTVIEIPALLGLQIQAEVWNYFKKKKKQSSSKWRGSQWRIIICNSILIVFAKSDGPADCTVAKIHVENPLCVWAFLLSGWEQMVSTPVPDMLMRRGRFRKGPMGCVFMKI